MKLLKQRYIIAYMQVWFQPFEKALAVNIKRVQVIVCVGGSDLRHLMQWSVSYLLSSGNHTLGSANCQGKLTSQNDVSGLTPTMWVLECTLIAATSSYS